MNKYHWVQKIVLACIFGFPALSYAVNCGWPPTEDNAFACSSEFLFLGEKLRFTYDHKLNTAVTSKERQELQTMQENWGNTIRNSCTTVECLEHAYKLQITLLQGKYMTAKVLPEEEFAQTCTSIAALANSGQLNYYTVEELDSKKKFPAPHVIYEDTTNGYGSSLNLDKCYYLNNNGKEFDSFFTIFTGGTCYSDNVESMARILTYPDSKSFVDVDDPDELIRWGYYANRQRPMVYQGRYYLIGESVNSSRRASDPNEISLVSWIRPSGEIQTLCTLGTTVEEKIIVQQNGEICQSFFTKEWKPLEWEKISGGKDVDVLRNYVWFREQNHPERLIIDANGDGVKESFRRAYASEASSCGVGYERIVEWDEEQNNVAKTLLTEALHPDSNVRSEIYEYEGKYYFSSSWHNFRNLSRLTKKGDVEEVCLFMNPRSVEKVFTPKN